MLLRASIGRPTLKNDNPEGELIKMHAMSTKRSSTAAILCPSVGRRPQTEPAASALLTLPGFCEAGLALMRRIGELHRELPCTCNRMLRDRLHKQLLSAARLSRRWCDRPRGDLAHDAAALNAGGELPAQLPGTASQSPRVS